MVTHPEPVDVEARLGLLLERGLGTKPLEGAARLLVDDVRVRICPFGQLDLGPTDAEEAEGSSGDQGPRLVRVDHVVRDRGDRGGDSGTGPEGTEGSEGGHAPDCRAAEGGEPGGIRTHDLGIKSPSLCR